MNKQWIKFVVVAIGLVLSVRSASGQIVSMSEKKYQEGIDGKVSLGFSMISNTVESMMGTGKVDLRYRKDAHSYTFAWDIAYSEVDKKKNVNNGSMGLMYNYEVPDRVVIAEAFGQFQYNSMQQLDARFLAGGGPRFKLIEEHGIDCSLVGYAIYLYEKYERQPNLINEKSLFKFSSMFTLGASISPTTKIKHSTYYEPDFSNLTDYRLWSETVLKIKVINDLSFNCTFRLDYNSLVPAEVRQLMYSIRNSIVISF